MKSLLLGTVCAFCLLANQPSSADLLDGQIRLSSNLSFTAVGFSSDLFVNQNVFTKPPGSPPAVPVPQALLLFGAGLLGLAGIARRK